jgi:hypothetical protein
VCVQMTSVVRFGNGGQWNITANATGDHDYRSAVTDREKPCKEEARAARTAEQ